jgi:hypothetical protein
MASVRQGNSPQRYQTKVPFARAGVLQKLFLMRFPMSVLLRRARTLTITIAATALLGSCAEFSTQHAGSLHRQGSALVAIPLDATYHGRIYEGSGQETAKVVAAAFRRHLQQVEIMSGNAFYNSMDASGASRFDYLVMPSIIQWEDSSVKRSRREDHVEIGIRVMRTSDGATLAQWRVKKPSRVSTIFNASPAEQLSEPIEEYVNELFRGMGR